MAGAFEQPALPGYSPWPQARQESPFLRTPGTQGQQEGVSAGQGLAFTPQQEFFAGGTEGSAPPSSVPPSSGMWQKFGGSGGASSSFVAPDGGNAAMTQQPQGMMAPPPSMQMQPASAPQQGAPGLTPMPMGLGGGVMGIPVTGRPSNGITL